MPSPQESGNSLDLVDIKEIKDGTVILKDGSLRQVIMVGGVNFALKSDTDQNIMLQGYQNFLNGIDFSLQIVIHSRKVNIEKYVNELAMRKEQETSAIIKNQIDEYVQFIKGFIEKNAVMEKMFFMIIPFYPINLVPSGTSSFFSFFGKKKGDPAAEKKSDEERERVFQQNLEQIAQRTDQAVAGLTSLGLEATVLANDQLIELFYNFYNPQTIERNNVISP
jgi:type IV secretory pathway VirB4 component